jgi:hypothetical protein
MATLLAHPIYLIRRDMVGTVRQLGKLNGDGNSVARSSKVTSDLNGLERLLLLVENERHGVPLLEVAGAASSACLRVYWCDLCIR